jgi:copper chaperone
MATLKVEGMSCNHCVTAIVKALESIQGLKNAKVDLVAGEVTYEEDLPVDMGEVRSAIEQAGYRVG